MSEGQPTALRRQTSLPALAAGETHVWFVELASVGADELRALSDDERRRADRFVFDRDRKRFAAARAALRAVIGHYLATDAGAVRFAYGDRGKPELAKRTEVPVRFSVSHSGGIALLALASRAVGVDVEEVAPVVDHLELARAYFSAEESRALASQSAAQGLRTFFRMWTVKEAYLKATGTGIGDDLARPRVAFEAGTPLIDARSVEGDWTVHELHPQPGYAAAAVVEGRSGIVRAARWPPPAADASAR